MGEQLAEATLTITDLEFGFPLIDPERGLVATDSDEHLLMLLQPIAAEGSTNA